MATAKVQYIIPRYSSQAGTFGQKLIYHGKGRGKERAVVRLPSVCYRFDNYNIQMVALLISSCSGRQQFEMDV